jgi:hypothetical protein
LQALADCEKDLAGGAIVSLDWSDQRSAHPAAERSPLFALDGSNSAGGKRVVTFRLDQTADGRT